MRSAGLRAVQHAPGSVRLRDLDRADHGLLQQPLRLEQRDPGLVRRRPPAAGAPRGEPLPGGMVVRPVVEHTHGPVDPTEAERLFDCLREQNALACSMGFFYIQPDLILLIMVLRQPFMPF